jgi:hypothetical protein
MNNHRLFSMSFLIVFQLLTLYSNKIAAQPRSYNVTSDGTWCWFSDPRAIYLPNYHGNIILGYVTEDGSVASLLYNPKSGFMQQSLLNPKLEIDDHDNPAFLQTNDSTVLAFYTKHINSNLYMHSANLKNGIINWSDVKTINPNGKADLARFGDNNYTYANPCMLSGENNRIYLFGRWIGYKPNITWSDDGGTTWAESRVIISSQPFNPEQRPYVKYYSDGKDKIHIIFTDGHPRDEETNSVYYVCYSHGAFYRANGEKICTIDQLPFDPKEATLVYDAKRTRERAWIFDIVADSSGNPYIAYTRYPSTKEHIYHYAWFDGKKWNDREVVNSGKWFPTTPAGVTEPEPHYSGGIVIDPFHPNTLYLSRELASVFEIEQWIYHPETDSWVHSPITKDSNKNQIRPYVVKNTPVEAGTILLWNSVERYIHYTNFKTGVRICIIKN